MNALVRGPARRCAVAIAVAFVAAATARALTPFVFESQTLLGSTSSLLDTFGHSVAISGDVIVVGAPFEDDGGVAAGAAYVFRRDGGLWLGEQTLLDPDGANGDQFGTAVAVDAEVIAIGAFSDALGNASGAVHVYRFDGTSWVAEQTLLASDGAQADTFGSALAISDDLIVVGAPFEDELGDQAGAAYVFRYDGASWIEEQKLSASDAAAAAQFGDAVGIAGRVVVIGALGDAEQGENAGAAYVFRRDRGVWVEEQKLLASDGATLDRFGAAVAIAGARVLVGAFNHGESGDAAGAAYLYRRDGAVWVEEQKLLAS
ncbi:MAG TPA: FG-GAP repeat protein, partial [Myxococcota bacterium]|nr:FG-GAP repeat protein [Myxococcota bacterium]